MFFEFQATADFRYSLPTRRSPLELRPVAELEGAAPKSVERMNRLTRAQIMPSDWIAHMRLTEKERKLLSMIRKELTTAAYIVRGHYDVLFAEMLNKTKFGRFVSKDVPPGCVEVSEETAREWAAAFESVQSGEIAFLPSAYVRMVGRAMRRSADALQREREANEAAEAANIGPSQP